MDMDRCERAYAFHKNGYNCCQSVLAAFSDKIGLPEEACAALGSGFGGGAGTGELCGAVSGAVMVLGLLHPAAPNDPTGGKKRAVMLARTLQTRFAERFNALRCRELLQEKFVPDDSTPAAKALEVTEHCDIMIVTAVELVEQMLSEEQAQ